MAIRKQSRRFGARYLIRNTCVIFGFGLLLLVFWYLLPTFHTWIFVAVFICTIISLIAVEQYGFRTFHCPDCNRLLPKRDIWDGTDHITCFVCKDCDIEWDTGLEISHD